jgi:hypothetical protein
MLPELSTAKTMSAGRRRFSAVCEISAHVSSAGGRLVAPGSRGAPLGLCAPMPARPIPPDDPPAAALPKLGSAGPRPLRCGVVSALHARPVSRSSSEQRPELTRVRIVRFMCFLMGGCTVPGFMAAPRGCLHACTNIASGTVIDELCDGHAP